MMTVRRFVLSMRRRGRESFRLQTWLKRSLAVSRDPGNTFSLRLAVIGR